MNSKEMAEAANQLRITANEILKLELKADVAGRKRLKVFEKITLTKTSKKKGKKLVKVL